MNKYTVYTVYVGTVFEATIEAISLTRAASIVNLKEDCECLKYTINEQPLRKLEAYYL